MARADRYPSTQNTMLSQAWDMHADTISLRQPQGQSDVRKEPLKHVCCHSLLKLFSILGTPGGGKAKLIQTGAYDNLDCSLMAHPGPKVYMFYAEYPALMAARVDWTGG